LVDVAAEVSVDDAHGVAEFEGSGWGVCGQEWP
jgi:hypothetical protein